MKPMPYVVPPVRAWPDAKEEVNAVPAVVEFEIGILEQQTYQHYKSIPTAAAQANYLEGQAGRVHLFRQRVAVRNVDATAYQ